MTHHPQPRVTVSEGGGPLGDEDEGKEKTTREPPVSPLVSSLLTHVCDPWGDAMGALRSAICKGFGTSRDYPLTSGVCVGALTLGTECGLLQLRASSIIGTSIVSPLDLR